MRKLLLSLLVLAFLIAGCTSKKQEEKPVSATPPQVTAENGGPQGIPGFTGKPYAEVNNNRPFFKKEDIERAKKESFENYSPLDNLGRCGVAYARIGKDVMPTEPRGKIGMVKPSGWKMAKYDIVDGKYLYNRCHLIGFQLAGENANPLNLITGTRYLNVVGMLPFENRVADYVKSSGNHVLYRVTPLYVGDELVARGVVMEAYSVEDDGILSFNVFCYNNQPGIEIDYRNGDSRLIDGQQPAGTDKATQKSIERHKKKEAKKGKKNG